MPSQGRFVPGGFDEPGAYYEVGFAFMQGLCEARDVARVVLAVGIEGDAIVVSMAQGEFDPALERFGVSEIDRVCQDVGVLVSHVVARSIGGPIVDAEHVLRRVLANALEDGGDVSFFVESGNDNKPAGVLAFLGSVRAQLGIGGGILGRLFLSGRWHAERASRTSSILL